MPQLKYKDIKATYERQDAQVENGFLTQAEIDEVKEIGDPMGYTLGYYSPSGANWAYEKKLIRYKGEIYEVVLVFGWAKAVAKISDLVELNKD